MSENCDPQRLVPLTVRLAPEEVERVERMAEEFRADPQRRMHGIPTKADVLRTCVIEHLDHLEQRYGVGMLPAGADDLEG